MDSEDANLYSSILVLFIETFFLTISRRSLDFPGGTMQGDFLDFDTSPNDPLWFSHHAQLDRLHYYWMQYIGEALATDEDPCGGYYGTLTPEPQVP